MTSLKTFFIVAAQALTSPAASSAQVIYDPIAPLEYTTIEEVEHEELPSPTSLPSEKDMPSEARKIVMDFDQKVQEIRKNSEKKIDDLRNDVLRRLKPLQEKYSKEAKLDEAVAIRDQIRRIYRIKSDPGALHAREKDIGRIWHFEVIGSTRGSVWGSDIYTSDSRLAAAAVHAGVLKPGQKGIIKVTVLPGQTSYKPSSRNGVTTLPWESWGVSFRIEKHSP